MGKAADPAISGSAKEKMNKEIKKVTFYRCPACGMSSTDRKQIQDHFKTHSIQSEEWVYCHACGAGWSVAAYGKKRAEELARDCYKRHISDGNLIETASKTFFLSGGEFGFYKIIKGGSE